MMRLPLCPLVAAARILVAPALLIGCVVDGEPAEPEPTPAPSRIWVAGDFHVHSEGASNDVGNGGGDPSEIKALALERGLDFVVLTDHSNSTGSDLEGTEEDPDRYNMGPEFTHHAWAASLTDSTFTMVVGSEISTEDTNPPRAPSGHVGCIPPAGEFDRDTAFVDRPFGDVGGASAVQQANDRGCFSVVNHPYSGVASWIQYDWGTREYDAIEVWNGGLRWDEADESALAAVVCDHLSGKRTGMVGGSDMHRLTDTIEASPLGTPLAFPKTWVLSESLAWEDIREGLLRGNTVVADFDNFIDVQIVSAAGDVVGVPGDVVPSGATLKIVARSAQDASLQVLVYDANSCSDPRAPGVDTPPTLSRRDRLLLLGVDAGGVVEDELPLTSEIEGMVVVVRLDTDAPDGHVIAAPISVVGPN